MMRAIEAIKRAAEILRTILGVPNYDRYVAHMRRHHPELSMLSRDQFVDERMMDRYARPGTRCC